MEVPKTLAEYPATAPHQKYAFDGFEVTLTPVKTNVQIDMALGPLRWSDVLQFTLKSQWIARARKAYDDVPAGELDDAWLHRLKSRFAMSVARTAAAIHLAEGLTLDAYVAQYNNSLGTTYEDLVHYYACALAARRRTVYERVAVAL